MIEISVAGVGDADRIVDLFEAYRDFISKCRIGQGHWRSGAAFAGGYCDYFVGC